RRPGGIGPCVLSCQIGVRILVTDNDAKPKTAQGKSGEAFPRADAVIKTIRGENVHPGQPISQGNIFTKRDAMNLVVMSRGPASLLDQNRRIIASWVFVRS